MPASYPVSIKNFLTYQNQPGDSHHILTDGTDLTIDHSKVTNEIHDEVLAVEQTMGVRPSLVPTKTTMGRSIHWLYYNKAPGIPDPTNHNCIYYPLPLPSHTHIHAQSHNLDADDHPQYVRADGSRGFSTPITSPNAQGGNQLITLGQAQGAGLTSSQVQSIIQSDLNAVCPYPVTGPTPGRFKMTGGSFFGYTNAGGNIYIDFGPARFNAIISFTFMKMPFPGRSAFGYVYQYEEDQLVLFSLSLAGAWIQFIEDIVVDRRAQVAMTWLALGV